MSAKVYSSPVEEPDFDDYFVNGRFDMGRQERLDGEFLERLVLLCKRNGDDPLLGEEIRWLRGDGYARYVVWNVDRDRDQVELIWLQLGDAWEVEAPLIRGLNVEDVEELVAQQHSLLRIFGPGSAS